MTIADRIKMLRLSLMVHSVIYYDLNDNIITDSEWTRRAKELVELQTKHPDIAASVKFHELYKDFDGSTGFHLAANADDAARGKARYLLQTRGNRKRKQ